jgi:hypothetical protein
MTFDRCKLVVKGELHMSYAQGRDARLLQRLQRSLPLSAYGRPALLAFLRTRGSIGGASSRLKIVSIFQAGRTGDLMCRFSIEGRCGDETFFAPLAQLALDRRHPAARELALRRQQSFRHGAA